MSKLKVVEKLPFHAASFFFPKTKSVAHSCRHGSRIISPLWVSFTISS